MNEKREFQVFFQGEEAFFSEKAVEELEDIGAVKRKFDAFEAKDSKTWRIMLAAIGRLRG